MNIETPTGHTMSVSGGGAPGGPQQQAPSSQQQPQPHPQQQQQQQQQQVIKTDKDLLNSYIYDYLLKHNLVESARAFSKETDPSGSRGPNSRTSTPNPAKKNGKENDSMNGIHDGMCDFILQKLLYRY